MSSNLARRTIQIHLIQIVMLTPLKIYAVILGGAATLLLAWLLFEGPPAPAKAASAPPPRVIDVPRPAAKFKTGYSINEFCYDGIVYLETNSGITVKFIAPKKGPLSTVARPQEC